MTSAKPLTIRLNAADNVVIARADLLPGTTLAGENVTIRQHIPAGHKVATRPIADGEPIHRYGQIIGFAQGAVEPGTHVHVQNCVMKDFARDYAHGTLAKPTEMVPDEARATFQGFRRDNGKVGTRNYLGIISTVNCSATVVHHIADHFNRGNLLGEFPNIDGVVALAHSTGCGMADTGEGFEALQRTMWGFASHPNFAGVLMIGLGCEVNQIPFFLEAYGLKQSDTFQSFTIQGSGGTRKTIEEGIARINAILPAAARSTRTTCPAGELSLALQCGGSDGLSGITANPALGAASDLLVRHGGTAILSETPEVYGAEHLLTRRAVSRPVGEKLVERIRWWEEYVQRNGGQMNNNPSPGNKAGGLTTILEKSLGAATKGGTTNLTGVYKYGETITTKGFVFVDTPGYDPCSATGQVASGGNILAFTTGRGSAFGYKPVPSIKLATNSALYNRQTEDMDINCGDIVDGTMTVPEKGQQIFDLLLRVASGEQSKSEAFGYGDHEFIPWQIGATM